MANGIKLTVVERSRTLVVDFQYATTAHRRQANTVRNNTWSTILLLLVRLFLLCHHLYTLQSANSSLIIHFFWWFCVRPICGIKYQIDVFAENRAREHTWLTLRTCRRPLCVPCRFSIAASSFVGENAHDNKPAAAAPALHQFSGACDGIANVVHL